MNIIIIIIYVCVLSMKGSVLTNRKSSSTPSLSDVSESKSSVASTEQAASAENLTSTIKVVSHFDKAPTYSGFIVEYYWPTFPRSSDDLYNKCPHVWAMEPLGFTYVSYAE